MASAPPIRVLLSRAADERFGARIRAQLGSRPHAVVHLEAVGDSPVDIALLTRDVTSTSSKLDLSPSMRSFFDTLDASPRLAWVHTHSAGADRPMYPRLMARGVTVTTSSGANAVTVAVSAIGGVIALARRFPLLMEQQRRHAWKPFQEDHAPRDLAGQHAVVVGLGPIGREISRLLRAFGVTVTGARMGAGEVPECDETITYADLRNVLPKADWLVLACPLTEVTRGMIDTAALAALRSHAHLINASRGEVVDEAALAAALGSKRLAGAWLDVFHHEPLDSASPFWDLPNVIVSPHTSSRSTGNYDRVGEIFLDNLGRWRDGKPMRNAVGPESTG